MLLYFKTGAHKMRLGSKIETKLRTFRPPPVISREGVGEMYESILPVQPGSEYDILICFWQGGARILEIGSQKQGCHGYWCSIPMPIPQNPYNHRTGKPENHVFSFMSLTISLGIGRYFDRSIYDVNKMVLTIGNEVTITIQIH